MLIRGDINKIKDDFSKKIDFTIMNGGEFVADTSTENVTGETSVCVNFKKKELAILGTSYAGEMKKGVFSIMHYYMPQQGALSMHASANEGKGVILLCSLVYQELERLPFQLILIDL